MIRTFVALDLDPTVKQEIERQLARFSELDPSIRWSPPANLHLTLKFLGDISESSLECFYKHVEAAATSLDPFPLSLQGYGQFPLHGTPRVLWMGVHDMTASLPRIAACLNSFLVAEGIPAEDRPYVPHFTLARLKTRPRPALMDWWKGRKDENIGSMTASEIHFYRSQLTKEGSIYTVLKTFKLGLKMTPNQR